MRIAPCENTFRLSESPFGGTKGALMLPSVPLEPTTWQVGLALALVWAAAFRFQLGRYTRFQERWDRKVLVHARAVVRVPAGRRFGRRR